MFQLFFFRIPANLFVVYVKHVYMCVCAFAYNTHDLVVPTILQDGRAVVAESCYGGLRRRRRRRRAYKTFVRFGVCVCVFENVFFLSSF